jgi:hypothetical protein
MVELVLQVRGNWSCWRDFGLLDAGKLEAIPGFDFFEQALNQLSLNQACVSLSHNQRSLAAGLALGAHGLAFDRSLITTSLDRRTSAFSGGG